MNVCGHWRRESPLGSAVSGQGWGLEWLRKQRVAVIGCNTLSSRLYFGHHLTCEAIVREEPLMVAAQPQFLLFCDAHVSNASPRPSIERVQGRWHFMLERLDGPERLEVTEAERALPTDRLALLAVVRGLEALEQPSHVTLITTSRYVSRGLRYGLSEWREANYSWEHFGIQRPIRNADLWQRIDCAMQFHRVACRLLESSLAHESQAAVEEGGRSASEDLSSGEPVLQRPARPVGRTEVERTQVGRTDWWGLAAGWRQWWSGRALRPAALVGV